MTFLVPGCAAEKQKPILATVPSGRLEWAGSLPVVHLTGTPYEMGYQFGSILKERTRLAVDGFLGFGDASLGVPLAGKIFARRKLDKAWEEMEPWVPQKYRDEMEGLADGAGVPLQWVRRIHALSELTAVGGAGFAAAGPETREGRTLHLRVLEWDLPADVRRYSVLVVRHPRKGNASAVLGWLGFTGALSGINDKGISVAQADTGMREEEMRGIPAPFLLRAVLDEAKDLEQAAEVVKRGPRTSGGSYLFADAWQARAVALETARDGCDLSWMGAGSSLRMGGPADASLLEKHPHPMDPEGMLAMGRGILPRALQSVVYAYPELHVWNSWDRNLTGENRHEKVDLRRLFEEPDGRP